MKQSKINQFALLNTSFLNEHARFKLDLGRFSNSSRIFNRLSVGFDRVKCLSTCTVQVKRFPDIWQAKQLAEAISERNFNFFTFRDGVMNELNGNSKYSGIDTKSQAQFPPLIYCLAFRIGFALFSFY